MRLPDICDNILDAVEFRLLRTDPVSFQLSHPKRRIDTTDEPHSQRRRLFLRLASVSPALGL